MGAVGAARAGCSWNHGLAEVTAEVTVTSPVPPSLTVRPMVVVRVRPLAVPVTVTVAGPSAAALDAVNVSTLEAPVVEAGLKPAVTPDGSPLAVKATLAVKPLRRVMASVLVALPPRATETLLGFAVSEKSGLL